MTSVSDEQQCLILIIDDEAANVRLLERLLLRSGYKNQCSTTDARHALGLFKDHPADLVLLDLHMPYVDGFELLKQFASASSEAAFSPRIVLTADITDAAKHRALQLGATDFLTKPIDPIELLLRVRSALHTRLLSLALQGQNIALERQVKEGTLDLETARLEVIERLTYAASLRDDDTHEHTKRVGEMAAGLATILDVKRERVELLRLAAPLHDIGKIAIPDAILLKTARLDPREIKEMQEHTRLGANILAGGTSPLVKMAEEIALTHHERWNGTGYPLGLRESEIPLESRIVAIVDVFDALTHARPYKMAWSADEALSEIESMRGGHFDPDIADRFVVSVRDRSLRAA